ncbi:MAG: ribosome silencing factor [Bacteroidales bacterium]|nr:ribosome silencing factor [Bacteroidales bacterium]
MGRKVIQDDTESILTQIVLAMQEKKARNIISLDFQNIPDAVAKYFVICHGGSKTQTRAIFDNVIEKVKLNCKIPPFHREGYVNSEWLLIDYADVVVHVFVEEARNFYDIESLWADARMKEYDSEN